MSDAIRIWDGPRRPLLAGIAAAVAAVSLFAFPSVRAAADQFLQIFRVQTVLFMPVSRDRVAQLRSLDLRDKALFVARPEVVNHPTPAQSVGSAQEATAKAGYGVQEPATLPGTPTVPKLVVYDRRVFRFQVNLDSVRHMLDILGVNDVTLPDALGDAPITADLPPTVETRYAGADYSLTLIQGISPSVSLPPGVDLAQLGRAALRVLGMAPDQADALSRQIDWSSTLLFPFPDALDTVRQVPVGDAKGLLIGHNDRGGSEWALYVQRGPRFYVLRGQGRGLHDDDLIAAAASIQ